MDLKNITIGQYFKETAKMFPDDIAIMFLEKGEKKK